MFEFHSPYILNEIFNEFESHSLLISNRILTGYESHLSFISNGLFCIMYDLYEKDKYYIYTSSRKEI